MVNLLCNKYPTLYSIPRSPNEMDYLLNMHQEPSASMWGPRAEAAACHPYHSSLFTWFLFPSDALLFNTCIPIHSFSYIFIICSSVLSTNTSLKSIMYFTSQSWKAEAFDNHSHHFKCFLINKEWDDEEETKGNLYLRRFLVNSTEPSR